MAMTAEEKIDSRQGNEELRDIVYLCRGADGDTDQDAITAALAAAPLTRNDLPRQGVSSINAIAGLENSYEVRVHYGNDSVSFGGTAVDIGNKVLISFTTTGGSKNVKQSPLTMDWSGPNNDGANGKESVSDLKGAINVGQNGEVAGVDTPTGVFHFNIRKKYTPDEITTEFLTAIQDLVNCQNDAEWSVSADYGLTPVRIFWDRGQITYLGCDAAEPDLSTGKQEIVHHFRSAKNLVDFEPVPGWPAITKRGADYLWFRYQQTTDGTYMTVKPIACYVEQLCDPADFSALGLPS